MIWATFQCFNFETIFCLLGTHMLIIINNLGLSPWWSGCSTWRPGSRSIRSRPSPWPSWFRRRAGKGGGSSLEPLQCGPNGLEKNIGGVSHWTILYSYLLGQRFHAYFVMKFALQSGKGEKRAGLQISNKPRRTFDPRNAFSLVHFFLGKAQFRRRQKCRLLQETLRARGNSNPSPS